MIKRGKKSSRSNRTSATKHGKKRSRRVVVEPLERRQLLAASTYFTEDFQVLDLTASAPPAAVGEFNSSVSEFKVRSNGGTVALESDSQKHLGNFKNTRLHLSGKSSSSGTPQLFLRSNQPDVQDNGRFQFEYYKESNSQLRVQFGEVTGNDTFLDDSESLVFIEFRTDGKLRLRTGNGALTSAQTFGNNQAHVVSIDFDPGNTFTVHVDGEKVTAGGQDEFPVYQNVARVNSMQFRAAHNGSPRIFVDNVIMHDSAAETDIFFVDSGHSNRDDSVGNGQGLSADKPWASADFALRELDPGDTVYFKGGVYRTDQDSSGPASSGIGNFKPNSTGTAVKPIRVKGWRGVPTITSMYQPSTVQWQHEDGTPSNVYYFDSGEVNLNFKNVSHAVGGAQIPMRLMVPNGESKMPDDDGDPAHLDGDWQWTRTFVNSPGRVYVMIPSSFANPHAAGVQVSGSIATLDIRDDQHHISLEDIAVRGGYYGVRTKGDYTSFKRSRIENTYADAFKGDTKYGNNETRPDHGVIRDSLIKYFGESAVDITGGSHWDILENFLKFDVDNRLEKGVLLSGFGNDLGSGPQGNGLMLKGGGVDVRAIGNKLQDFTSARQGVITVGGSTNADDGYEAEDIVVKDNIIERVRADDGSSGGAYALVVTDSLNGTIENNTVRNSEFSFAVVQFQDGDEPAAGTNLFKNNKFFDGITIQNPAFPNTTTPEYVYRESGNGMSHTTFDGNKVAANSRYSNGGVNRSFSEFATYAANTSNLSVNDVIGLDVSGPEIVNSDAATLSDQQLQLAVAEAIDRWQSTGIDVSALSGVSATVGDLDGTLLGVVTAGGVVIDVNAAGYGWDLDDDDQVGVDLLTSVMHELGHLLGFTHTDDDGHGDLMNKTLAVGERFNPDDYQAKRLVAVVGNSVGSTLRAAANVDSAIIDVGSTVADRPPVQSEVVDSNPSRQTPSHRTDETELAAEQPSQWADQIDALFQDELSLLEDSVDSLG